MYCSNCGREIKEGIRFCPNCGKQLATIVRPLPPVQNTTLPPPPIPKMNMQAQQNNGYQSNTASGVRQYDGVYAEQTSNQQFYTDSYQTTSNYNEGQNQYYQNEPFYGQQVYEQPPRKNWYKVFIWVQLVFIAVGGIGISILYFLGMKHGENSTLIYSLYPGLRVIDVLLGVLQIGVVLFAGFVHYQLAQLKKNSPYMLLGLFSMGIFLNFIEALFYTIIIGKNCFTTDTISGMLQTGVIIAFYYFGFKKRIAYYNQ